MKATYPIPVLPREAVIDAALACGIPARGMETRNWRGRKHKVELVSPWGWADKTLPDKVAKAREITDKLQAAGFVCGFDVLWTGGFDAVFELIA